MKSKNKNLKTGISTSAKIILFFGILFRFIAFLFASPAINQHDVIQRYGHFDYAMYLFMYNKLPPMGGYEFAQPPINAALQALLMKFLSLFKDYSDNYLYLYSHTKILSLIYSIITLIIIYKILKEFDIPKIISNCILAIMSFYPGIIIMTTQYSNDNISYMFFYLSLLLTIRWCKNKKLSTIILLALSIGIGMLTKISVGLIAFITGPMMLIIWIRSLLRVNANVGASYASPEIAGESTASPPITLQLIVFALIVFPIGLSYSIRNKILFDIPIGVISEIAANSPLDMKNYNWTFIDRFLSLPFNRIVDTKNSIYHDYIEYNIWIDLVKTATFDEFNFSKTIWHPLCVALYILNYIFHILGISTIVLNIKDIIRVILESVRTRTVNCETVRASYASPDAVRASTASPDPVRASTASPYLNLKIISVMLFILAIAAYVGFNYKYQYSCNSNYRYIAYITLSFAISMAIKCLQKSPK